jgi:hypothetical protein
MSISVNLSSICLSSSINFGTRIFLVIIEVVLGVMLLIGYKSKFTIWVCFWWLVFSRFDFYLLIWCSKRLRFWDALHLTPWQSFTKDIVLLFFILILFINKNLVKPLFQNALQNIIAYASIILCMFMAVWVLNHLPLLDFRAYKVI